MYFVLLHTKFRVPLEEKAIEKKNKISYRELKPCFMDNDSKVTLLNDFK